MTGARTVLIVVLALVITAVAALVAHTALVPAAGDPAPARGQPVAGALSIVALGDSYMAGEGAGTFYRGTDRPGRSTCHRSPTAYPVRVADALAARLAFVACSGARTYNIGTSFPVTRTRPRVQHERSGEGLQIETLRAHADADVVLLSIGGNDARFSEIVALCAGRGVSCVPKASDWLDGLDAVVQPVLRELYDEVARTVGPTARIYVTTYPAPFGRGVTRCGAVGMAKDEVGFVRRFVDRLNDQIRLAAAYAGFAVVDLSDALQAGGLCARDGAPPAINGWRLQKNDGLPHTPMDAIRGSFHPTERGHARMAASVVEHVRERPSPAQVPPGGPPDWPLEGPPGPPPLVPPTLPPYMPEAYGPPLGPYAQEPNPCTPAAARLEAAEISGAVQHLRGARPGSLVCFQTHLGDWRTARADGLGQATLRFPGRITAGLGGLRRVLYRDPAGVWVQLVLEPGRSAAPPDVSMVAAWASGQARPLAVAVLAGLLVWCVAVIVAARWIVRRVV